MKNYKVGIDLGGTKIEGVILDADTHKILWRERIATEKEGGYDHILNRIASLINIISKETGGLPPRIGIGTPGAIDPITNLMKNSNTVCLNDRPMGEDLIKLVGTDLVFANDANCFALAEARMGSVPDVFPDAKVVFGVIMGTGVGGGLVINGEVLNGRMGIAGEWGHIHLDDSGGTCYCGKLGCVERVLAGPHLERFYTSLTGQQKKLKDIVLEHRAGTNPNATKVMERMVAFFGKGLAKIINIIDPDAIVIGGGVGNIDELYTQGVEELKKHVFNKRMDTMILKPKLGDSAGVIGAAFL